MMHSPPRSPPQPAALLRHGPLLTEQVRDALRLRYALLPYLYTLFALHRVDGALVMRPLWYEFPHDAGLRGGPWWMPTPTPPPAEEAVSAPSDAMADGAVADGDAAADASVTDGEAARRTEEGEATDAVAEDARRLEAEADSNGDAGDEGDAEHAGSGAGDCPCFKCSEVPCKPPECGKCGTKKASGCKTVNGVPYPEWGCYTTAAAECECNDDPAYDDDEYERYRGDDDERDRDEEYERYRGDDDEYGEDYERRYRGEYGDDDDAEYKMHDADADDDEGGGDATAATDYNAEYYHGESPSAGDGEDEGQPQTGEQFMLGPHILVQPITALHIEHTHVYLPADADGAEAVWYDLRTAAPHVSTPAARVLEVAVHADHVPAYVRGGAVLPMRYRLRRASQSTHIDPFTLIVAPRVNGSADGELFLDAYDGFEEGVSLTARLSFRAQVLTNSVKRGADGVPPAARSLVERIVLWGQTAAPRAVIVRAANGEVVSTDVQILHDAEAATLTLRQPKVSMGEEWSIELVQPADAKRDEP